MFKRTHRIGLIAICAALCALLAVGVASAAASTAYVSNSAPVVPGGKSCAQPGYSGIQEAVFAGSSKVKVCPGTYTEQVTITQPTKLEAASGPGTATVKLPASIKNATTSCETAINPAEYRPNQDLISICTPGTVSISGLTLEALWPAGTCYDSMYGIFVSEATLKATNVTVNGAGAIPINGCQGGIGIAIGTARTKPAESAQAILNKVSISSYQKVGIAAYGAGSAATINGATVTGAGPTPAIAQNGLEVLYGAIAKVKGSVFSGNQCEAASCSFTGTQSAGALLFLDGPGTSITTTTFSENDFGVYYLSESPTQPASPEATLTNDNFTSNRYEGVILDQGKAALKSDTISGPSKIGIEIEQYKGQTLASESTAVKTTISGQSEAGIKVYSDKAAKGDIPGKFTFSKGTVTEPVLINESNNFEVIF